ncbi:MAG: hypothetical protein R2748_25180 [Bryobacterales bacterium]
MSWFVEISIDKHVIFLAIGQADFGHSGLGDGRRVQEVRPALGTRA